MKTLIAYGTRHGATAQTADEIAKTLREETFGFDVRVVNLKKEKIEDISEYEFVIVGSGLQSNKWTNEAEDFLKKFHKDLALKKVAVFVSTAFVPLYQRQDKTAEVEQSRKRSLEEKVAAYSLNPIAMEIFGGIMDFNKIGFLTRKTLGWTKSAFEDAGYKETKPGTYDTRDWTVIKDWARKLILKARYF
jgi:menaquinone-dependent protoporphyrinogen oxidase